MRKSSGILPSPEAPLLQKPVRFLSSGAFRDVYVAKFAEAVHVLHMFQKKARKTSKADLALARQRYGLIPGSGNIFVNLGFDPAEARIMALRVELMARLERHLEERGCTQAEAARLLGVTQPRVSALLKGKWQDFSLDMLLTLAARAGLKPELRLAA